MKKKENASPDVFLDINKVLREKNPSLHKKIPAFVIKRFEKAICVDKLNNFLLDTGLKYGTDFTDAAVKKNNLEIIIKGQENIPKNGRFTFASNHPLGGLDGIILCGVLGKRYPNFLFLVNDLLMNVKNVKQFFLPINKHGSQAKDSARVINEAYASDRQICLFPAGLVSRKSNKIVKDLEWKKNFITKSIQHKRDIIPLHITGQNSKRFYRIAWLRKFLGIKVNIEMMTLGCEVFKFRDRSVTITFGKPIDYQQLDRSKSPMEWAQVVKEATYNLAKQ